LTIKGASRNVVVPVALAQTGAATTATGAFVIKRLDFKVGDGDWKDTSMVADDVQVRFRLALTGVGPL
jgi:polyisoprenoid-binding protein YceI